jgi:hypothetical protein
MDIKAELKRRSDELTRKLAFGFPLLVKRWHPTKNGVLRPDMFCSTSHEKVWWICSRGHDHQSAINNMVAALKRGAPSFGCPFCAGGKATGQNNLAVSFPELAKEWNQEKNQGIIPCEVLPQSHFRAWWKCKMGHEWQTSVQCRTAKGSCCPKCRLFGISRFEARVFSEVKSLWSDAESKVRLVGRECDIFLPSLKIVVEIDGFWWHQNAQERDAHKNKVITKAGFRVIRLREEPLPLLTPDDISFEETAYNSDSQTLTAIKALVSTIGGWVGMDVSHYLLVQGYANNSAYETLLKAFPLPAKGSSLADKFPAIAMQWHPTKNGTIVPGQLRSKSNKKVWWKCEKGHEWEASPSLRTYGCGCPYCATGQKICADNNLFAKRPDIVRQWNHEKNADFDLDKIGTGSTEKVWWRCDDGHEWQAVIKERCRARNSSCPQCARLRHSERMRGNDFRCRKT